MSDTKPDANKNPAMDPQLIMPVWLDSLDRRYAAIRAHCEDMRHQNVTSGQLKADMSLFEETVQAIFRYKNVVKEVESLREATK